MRFVLVWIICGSTTSNGKKKQRPCSLERWTMTDAFLSFHLKISFSYLKENESCCSFTLVYPSPSTQMFGFSPLKKRRMGKFFFFSRVRACSRGRTLLLLSFKLNSLVFLSNFFFLLYIFFFFFFLFCWGREGIEGTRYDSSGASRVNMPQQTWRCWENIKRI